MGCCLVLAVATAASKNAYQCIKYQKNSDERGLKPYSRENIILAYSYKSILIIMQKRIYIFDEWRPIYEAEFEGREKRNVIVSDDECNNNLKTIETR